MNILQYLRNHSLRRELRDIERELDFLQKISAYAVLSDGGKEALRRCWARQTVLIRLIHQR